MMNPAYLATNLLLLVFLAACGDATAPNGESGAPQAGSATPDKSNPSDVLAALPPEAQPYGLDVYTAKCVACHGDLGQGVDKSPPLRGLTRAAMQQKLLDYRAGKTLGEQAAVMAKAVSGLSDAEIAAASVYAGE
jgi:cytochrome c553